MSAMLKQLPMVKASEITEESFVNTFARFGDNHLFALRLSTGEYVVGEGSLYTFGRNPDQEIFRTTNLDVVKSAIVGCSDEGTAVFFTGFFFNTKK